jgi:hypothetical protein
MLTATGQNLRRLAVMRSRIAASKETFQTERGAEATPQRRRGEPVSLYS